MSDGEYVRDESLIHLDGLRTLSQRAKIAGGPSEKLDYERLGVCTPDLVTMAGFYAQSVTENCGEQGLGIPAMFVYQFLAGFDIGYQAALERESRIAAGVVEDKRQEVEDQQRDASEDDSALD